MQTTIPDAFPELDEELEKLVSEYNKAKLAEQKCKDRITSKYDAIKERMRLLEHVQYKCYHCRSKVDMVADDPSIKVKKVKESEPSPYRPVAAEEPAPKAD